MDMDCPITALEARFYAWTDTGAAPGSRYGSAPADFIPVALAVAEIVADAMGEPLTRSGVDHALSLVVNNHDDPADLIAEYLPISRGLELIGDALIRQWEDTAFAIGADAARTAATWTTDGRTDRDHARRLLELLDDGDPAVWDELPAEPNLSGEWADGPTPLSLAQEIVGPGPYGGSLLDECDADGEILAGICDAFERGVDDTFADAVETALRAFVA